MKPVAGIELGTLFGEAQEDASKDKKAEVHAKIRAMILQSRSLEVEIEQKKSDLQKTTDKLAKLNQKLADIKSGKWEALAEENKNQQQGSNKQPQGEKPATTEE